MSNFDAEYRVSNGNVLEKLTKAIEQLPLVAVSGYERTSVSVSYISPVDVVFIEPRNGVTIKELRLSQDNQVRFSQVSPEGARFTFNGQNYHIRFTSEK